MEYLKLGITPLIISVATLAPHVFGGILTKFDCGKYFNQI
jgi:hypothetical protein